MHALHGWLIIKRHTLPLVKLTEPVRMQNCSVARVTILVDRICVLDKRYTILPKVPYHFTLTYTLILDRETMHRCPTQ